MRKNVEEDNIYESFIEEEKEEERQKELEKARILNNNNFNNNYNNYDNYNEEKKKPKLLLPFILILLIVGIYIAYKNINNIYIAEHKITFNLTSFGLKKTASQRGGYQLNYIIKPDSKIKTKIDIDNHDVIFINPTTFFVTPKKEGEAIIKIYEKNDKTPRDQVKVYVVNENIEVEDFIVNNLEIKKDDKDIIKITPVPENTTEIDFKYESLTPDIIEVTDKGIVTGLKKGNGIIKITNKGIEKEISVKVK